MVMELAHFKIKGILIKWLINTVALFFIVKTIKGLEISPDGFAGVLTLLITAAVIGVINVFIKPVILLLTLPINVLSFGLFTLVINGIMLTLAGYLVTGFEVTSFWGAVIGSIFFSILSMFFGIFVPDGKNDQKVKYRIIDED
jgi:putative membrane protein